MVSTLLLWYAFLPIGNPQDLAFIRAQESFVMGSTPLAAPPSPSDLADIGALGHRYQGYRDLAHKRLARDTLRDPRWLFWRSRVHGAEVIRRMDRIAMGFFRCPYCFGSGACPGKPVVTAKGQWGIQGDYCVLCWRGPWTHFHNSYDGEPNALCPPCNGTGWAFGEVWIEP